ncbi:hypothetical protein Pcar_3249 [Syntrophotalea carbinolica DSM 2380]|uniref:Uncharacterized protein n=1 Tax=Syntrophotalea carbinolica (strain DSM 2380 / NBRC 103641 / GraBd1) TaxID=338963 RepID=Q0C6R8_SYNC1|nr:hypothetical protein Pcar_3249 [Syntrophotalea carbinolica DSM 2380]
MPLSPQQPLMTDCTLQLITNMDALAGPPGPRSGNSPARYPRGFTGRQPLRLPVHNTIAHGSFIQPSESYLVSHIKITRCPSIVSGWTLSSFNTTFPDKMYRYYPSCHIMLPDSSVVCPSETMVLFKVPENPWPC